MCLLDLLAAVSQSRTRRLRYSRVFGLLSECEAVQDESRGGADQGTRRTEARRESEAHYNQYKYSL